MTEQIVSRSNPLVKHVRQLAASGDYRRREGQFLCDSPSCWRRLCGGAPAWIR